MDKPIKKETAYRLYLMSVLRGMCQAGWGGFTVHDLANQAGLKPTGNMYRQLRSFIADGSIALAPTPKTMTKKLNWYKFVIDQSMVGQ